MANELAMTPSNGEMLAALEVRQQVNQLQYLMRQVLQEGEHYGKVPGTGGKAKPTLFQSGAEKIAYMFKLVPRYQVTKTELPGGHREVEVICTLYQRGSNVIEGEGIGSCSTLESKYRYRNQWENGQKTKVENADIADTYNTVLKMAKKRALVDAVKSTTAASDIFTQDIEDLPEYMVSAQPAQRAAVQQQPARPPQEDMDWLRSTTAAIVALGYREDEVKPYLWSQYKQGGRQAAQEAAKGLMAAVGATDEHDAKGLMAAVGATDEHDAAQAAYAGDAEAAAAEEVEYEAEDIEF